MKESLLSSLCCPICSSRSFALEVGTRDEREIREGSLACRSCTRTFPIEAGIVDLMPDPTQVVRREQVGWGQMLGDPQESIAADILRLPYFPAEIWATTADNFDHALELMDFRDKRVLDVGAGRCWSSRRILEAGASEVVATDILRKRFIGLETADLFFRAGYGYFERVIADMHSLPFVASEFDVVFMSGTLHHSSDPGRVMREVARVLTPGGWAVVINEPVCRLFEGPDVDSPEIEVGINENVYTIWTYLRSTLAAGLRPWFFFPRSIDHRFEFGLLDSVRSELGSPGFQLVSTLRAWKWGRRLLGSRPTLALIYLLASMPLVMVAKKHPS